MAAIFTPAFSAMVRTPCPSIPDLAKSIPVAIMSTNLVPLGSSRYCPGSAVMVAIIVTTSAHPFYCQRGRAHGRRALGHLKKGMPSAKKSAHGKIQGKDPILPDQTGPKRATDSSFRHEQTEIHKYLEQTGKKALECKDPSSLWLCRECGDIPRLAPTHWGWLKIELTILLQKFYDPESRVNDL